MGVPTTYRYRASAIKKKLMAKLVAKQTQNLIAYAEKELQTMLETRGFNHRTYNLHDSYVWAVYYNGKREGYGFLDPAMASQPARFHKEKIMGRKEATDFLDRFKPDKNGWTIVWAACAPYAKYLDSDGKKRFYVITQRYDAIGNVLGKSNVTLM